MVNEGVCAELQELLRDHCSNCIHTSFADEFNAELVRLNDAASEGTLDTAFLENPPSFEDFLDVMYCGVDSNYNGLYLDDNYSPSGEHVNLVYEKQAHTPGLSRHVDAPTISLRLDMDLPVDEYIQDISDETFSSEDITFDIEDSTLSLHLC
eukprot:EC123808.1.p1 GENE.EC123808.1~~EC123808.1.p1  ORF type:complete len:152 (+),score=8.47 EC123808.1:91-546(+)